MSLIIANGRKAITLGEMPAVVITLGGADIPIDMVVTDSDTYDVIVGMNWLALAEANILVNESKMIIKSHGLEHEVQLNFDRTPKSLSHSSQSSNGESSEERVYNITEVPRENRDTQRDLDHVLARALEQRIQDRSIITSLANEIRAQRRQTVVKEKEHQQVRQNVIKKQVPQPHTKAEREQFMATHQRIRDAARHNPTRCPSRVCIRGKQMFVDPYDHAKCVLYEEWLVVCDKSQQIHRMGRHAPIIRWPMYYACRLFNNYEHPPTNLDCLTGHCFWNPDHGHR
jgi:hypothetical protein